jgi:hypothetical protein
MAAMTSVPGAAERRVTAFLAACIETGHKVLVISPEDDPRSHPEVASCHVDLVVAREESDGALRIMWVLEVLGVEDGVVQLQELFRRQAGELRPSGLRPRCLERLHDQGITLDPLTFVLLRPLV